VTVKAARVPYVLLTAVVLGLLSCPVVFVAFGRRDLRPIFLAVVVPPLLAAVGFLLLRYLARPTERSRRRLSLIFEVVSWIVAMAFLTVVSGVNLLVGIERIGAASVVFLVASVLWLPVVIRKRTALEDRLAALLSGRSATVIVAIVATAAVVTALMNLATPSRFSGG
jgi:hypothetical protein